ncbi:MAG: UDP-N-acetylmuramoyl-L-alanyl-D-glutamate--2,6-diaminopimelate ligase [Verrucomicrobia bacterium]|nr:UDP-N-acetylmuramoyl-L-alanyl-D-glutamate--2,6-diaminopimelate ligase [Verrucomicrobiota bacterium]
MKLKKLLTSLRVDQVKGPQNTEITGICSDSRRVSPGNLFVARKGLKSDGSRYICDAIAAGATVIATDLFDPSLRSVTQVISQNLVTLEADLAAEFYGYPSKELFTVGITGTNGKTSITYFIKYLFDALGVPCGLSGSIETIAGHWRYSSTHTTPNSTALQKLLREMVMQECQAAVMEVSSHALDQQRTRNVDFDVAIFTNFTQDHLDYHGSMENYLQAKLKLFHDAKSALINLDDPQAERFFQACGCPAISYGLSPEANLRAEDLKLSIHGSSFLLHGMPCHIPHIGPFNVSNWLAAVGAALLRGFSFEEILPLLPSAPPVPGRLERIVNPQELSIFVDYAHTPDALAKVLEILQQLKRGKLFVVFGCGGDRDALKRPLMGKIASTWADEVIITSDNPRTEDPQKIIDAILLGVDREATVIVDRKEAIATAISRITPKDTLLIAGKGHEPYQIIGHAHLPFDDRQIVRQICGENLP